MKTKFMKNIKRLLLLNFLCYVISAGYINAAEPTESKKIIEKKEEIDLQIKQLCSFVEKWYTEQLQPKQRGQQSSPGNALLIARQALPREIVDDIFAYAYNQICVNNIPLYQSGTKDVLDKIILESSYLDHSSSLSIPLTYSSYRSHALEYYRLHCLVTKWGQFTYFSIPIHSYRSTTLPKDIHDCMHEHTNQNIWIGHSYKYTGVFKSERSVRGTPTINTNDTVKSLILDQSYEKGITAAVITCKKNDKDKNIQFDLWNIIKEDSDETKSTFLPYALPHSFKKIAHLPTLPYTLLGLTASGDVYTIALQRPRTNEPRIECFKQNLTFLGNSNKRIIDFSMNPQSPSMVALLVTADTKNNAYLDKSSSTFELYTALLGCADGKTYVKKVTTFTNDYLDLLKSRLFPQSFPLTDKIETAVTVREGVAEIRNTVFLQEPVNGQNVGGKIFVNRLFYCPQLFDGKNMRTVQTNSAQQPIQTVQIEEK